MRFSNTVHLAAQKKLAHISLSPIFTTPEMMTRIVLLGTLVFAILLYILLCVSYFVLEHSYVLPRILIGTTVLIYLSVTANFILNKHIKIGAWMLTILYVLLAIFILQTWGINAPVGILILGFVILLASVMMGSRYIIGVTLGVIFILLSLHLLTVLNINHPDRSTLDNNSTPWDVISYSAIFSIFALIAWLSGRQTERALQRALNAEHELQKEKDLLAVRLEEKTKSLRESQIMEMKQLYRFAELGQLTTVILHELANYLSILTLDIDDIKERHQSSAAIEHAKESIYYIDEIIEKVREQIKESDNVYKFNVSKVLKETIVQLKKKLPNADIEHRIRSADRYAQSKIFGDPLRFAQAIVILATNADQATISKGRSRIIIESYVSGSSVFISVKDFGPGISSSVKNKLFEPHKSAKGEGLGIGLYIIRQIIETHFKGEITLTDNEHTCFTIRLPIST